MKITYTGKNDFPEEQRKKLDAKLAKIAKLLDGKGGEKDAHVILTGERHLHNAEITVNYYDHTMVGAASDPDLFTAVCSAVDKAEKQIQKYRSKWRDTKRSSRNGAAPKATLPAAPETLLIEEPGTSPSERRVFRVAGPTGSKPMTLEEALLEIDDHGDYLVYRDAESDGLSVLLRRKDGHFDLIES